MAINKTKNLVISAINLFEGGPLSILEDCLIELKNEKYINYDIKVLVHKIDLVKHHKSCNFSFIEFPLSRKSYFFRLYYEFFKFKQLSMNWDVNLWFSLHDITPNVRAQKRVVYCHNSTPFYKRTVKDFFSYPNLFLSSFFYKYFYKINIKKNDFVIVQPYWLKIEFVKLFGVKADKIIVASPILDSVNTLPTLCTKKKNDVTTFFYPCISRPFKNIEVIAQACRILSRNKISNFKLILTIDGTENRYSREIFEKFGDVKEIHFIGKQTRESVNKIYRDSDILLFPSTLETWGLPITEFKPFGKPMLVSNLRYAKETVGIYSDVDFLNPKNPNDWADKMHKIILKLPVTYMGNNSIEIPQPKANSWSSVFKILLLED